jgi:midasin (ATPase involved in ribosome maturation)
VGQYLPSDNPALERIAWHDGPVTHAYTTGSWLLLDNLSEAEPAVLERLNPVLEQPSTWVLTEKGDVLPCQQAPGWQFLATMTPPSKHGSRDLGSQGSELSPALANRFSIVHMDDPVAPTASEAAVMLELQQVASVLCSNAADVSAGLAAQACCLARRAWLQYNAGSAYDAPLTMRTFCRMLDGAYHLQRRGDTFANSLWHAYLTTVDRDIRHPVMAAELKSKMQQLLFGAAVTGAPARMLGLEAIEAGLRAGGHILTSSRGKHLEAVATAIACNQPVLLEGPPAVGKTALIVALSKCWPGGPVQVARVNNTEGTTAQDYFGMYLPAGNGSFVFQKGELFRAMEGGHWLLADEFNLADPAVLSVIAPLLEGARELQVPGTDKLITAAPGFRFFATQNPAKFADRHPLPLTLRSRFVVVQVEGFPAGEVAQVLQHRFPQQVQQLVALECLTTLYRDLQPTRLQLTLRDLIKAAHRSQRLGVPILQAALSLLRPRVALGSEEEELLRSCCMKHRPLAELYGQMVLAPAFAVKQLASERVEFSDGTISTVVKHADMRRVEGHVPASMVRCLVEVALCVVAREPVLLMGDTGYKTRVVKAWSAITGEDASSCLHVHLTPGMWH